MIVSFNGPTSRFVKPRVIWEENLNEEELFGAGWPVEMFLQQPNETGHYHFVVCCFYFSIGAQEMIPPSLGLQF